jgi:hypothetical protein
MKKTEKEKITDKKSLKKSTIDKKTSFCSIGLGNNAFFKKFGC